MNHIPNEELAKEIALAVKTSDGKIETINKILHLIKPLMKKGIPDIATLEYLKIKYVKKINRYLKPIYITNEYELDEKFYTLLLNLNKPIVKKYLWCIKFIKQNYSLCKKTIELQNKSLEYINFKKNNREVNSQC